MKNQSKENTKKINAKSILKICGNIIVIIALIFLVKKFMSFDIKLSDFTKPKIIWSFVISTLVQSALLFVSCIPWLSFTRAFSGKQIPYSKAMPVYTQSNILKYIPGNVFQYVGRNALAAEMNISHVDVASATIIDIFFYAGWTAVVSLIMLGGRIVKLVNKYGQTIVITALIVIAVAAVILVFFYFKFKDKFKEYILKYRASLNKKNAKSLTIGILYYLGHNIILAIMYFICLKLTLGNDASIEELVSLTGAYLFAWIIGFITIGAPGGIGVREGVMIFFTGGEFEEKILLFILVMRLGNIFADVIAFVIGKIYAVSIAKRNIIQKNIC
jgi:hypothetical protein